MFESGERVKLVPEVAEDIRGVLGSRDTFTIVRAESSRIRDRKTFYRVRETSALLAEDMLAPLDR